MSEFCSIEQAIQDIKDGKMIVVTITEPMLIVAVIDAYLMFPTRI